ncbi:hypothetical protein [Polaribacter filamentus]|nr:hypothetical protein [Polaribacter filamentus]
MYALLFLIIGLPELFRDADIWMFVLAILLPISCVLRCGYQKKYQYITIEHGSIRTNNFFQKEVQLSEIKTIEKYAGNYILKTDTKKLTIDTTIIAPNSLTALNAALDNLAIEWY